jgi:hypothetical protein
MVKGDGVAVGVNTGTSELCSHTCSPCLPKPKPTHLATPVHMPTLGCGHGHWYRCWLRVWVWAWEGVARMWAWAWAVGEESRATGVGVGVG